MIFQAEIHFDKIKLPPEGERIKIADGKLAVPDRPIISFIEGDGIGPDIMRAARKVWDAAVVRAYAGKRKIVWVELYAGEKALKAYGEVLPQDTFRARAL